MAWFFAFGAAAYNLFAGATASRNLRGHATRRMQMQLEHDTGNATNPSGNRMLVDVFQHSARGLRRLMSSAASGPA